MSFSRLLWIFYAVTFVLLFYGIFYAPSGMKAYLKGRAEVNQIRMQIERLMRENREIYERIERFRNDREFREFVVRQKLGWIRDGEQVIWLKPTEPQDGGNYE